MKAAQLTQEFEMLVPRLKSRAIHDFPGFGLITGALFVFLYAPLVVLVLYGFNSNASSLAWKGFSTEWYVAAATDGQILHAAIRSLEIAVITSVVTSSVALFGVVGLLRLRGWVGGLLTGLTAIPLIVPEIVLGVSLLSLFSAVSLPLGMVTMTLAHIAFCLPFAFLPVRAALSDLDFNVFEAAADLGASEMVIFRRLTFPALGAGVAGGALLSFVVSLDNFVLSYFTAGPGTTTLPLYIWGSLRVGISPKVNALSAFLLVISFTLVIFVQVIGLRKGGRK